MHPATMLLTMFVMDYGISGKHALVTGSTSGIGWAAARALAREKGAAPEAMQGGFVDELCSASLLKRLSSPDEVAAMIAYVCSTQASATTGAALRVDGGVVRCIA